MRIALLARHYDPAESGGAQRWYLLAGALHDADVDIRVCAPSLPEGDAGWIVAHRRVGSAATIAAVLRNFPEVMKGRPFWGDPDFLWSLRASNTVIADPWRPDWVISASPSALLHQAGEFIARTTGARWMADIQGAPGAKDQKRLLKLLPAAALVTTLDQAGAETIRRLGAKAVNILPEFSVDAAVASGQLEIAAADNAVRRLLAWMREARTG